MSNTIFPRLLGETFPVLKELTHNTLIQTSAAGLEVRIARWTQPRYRWTISYGYLNHDPAVATADLQTLYGFYESMHGSYSSFLYEDPTDYVAAVSNFGIGDGVTTKFRLARTMGGASHLVYAHKTSPAPKIYLNAVEQSSGVYSITNGLVTFNAAPSNGVALTADFQFYYRVRFQDDSLEFTNECGPYWTVKSVKLYEVREAS